MVYNQLTIGKATSRYPWVKGEFYNDILQTLLSRSYTSLEWAINSPPKPHAFNSLPLQSSLPGGSNYNNNYSRISELVNSPQEENISVSYTHLTLPTKRIV